MSELYDKTQLVPVISDEAPDSGGGIGGRDLLFYFDTKAERDAAAERIAALGLEAVSVVRSEEVERE